MRKTLTGMFAVVSAYADNQDRGRREATLLFYTAESSAEARQAGADVRELIIDRHAHDHPVRRAEVERMRSAAAFSHSGLGHGSLQSIHTEWRSVFQVPMPGTAVTVPLGETTESVRQFTALRFSAAWLTFRNVAGLIVTKLVTDGRVEEARWGELGGPQAIVSFEDDGEPYNELMLVSDVRTAVADGTVRGGAIGVGGAETAGGGPVGGQLALIGGGGLAAAPGAPRAAAGAAGAAAVVQRAAPRSEALSTRALPGEFAVFVDAVLPWCVMPERLAALRAFPTLASSELERWLVKQGDKAIPAVLAGPPASSSAADLLEICSAFGRDGCTPSTVPHGTSAGVQPYLLSPTDFTGSEREQRERAALREDAELLKADSGALSRLSAMAQAVATDPTQLFQAANREPSEPLLRLIHSGDEVRKALTGQLPPSVETELASVRGGLDRRLERAVLSKDADCAPKQVLSALRWVRLGRLGKVRLLDLIGHSDGSTDEDPLGGFAGCEGDGTPEFSLAMVRLALAWSVAWPPHTAASLSFTAQLSEFVVAKRGDQGVPWSALSCYYRSLMRVLDAGSRRYALREEHIQIRSAPSIDWIEGPYEYVRTLERDAAKAQISTLRADLVAQFAATLPGGSSSDKVTSDKKSLKRKEKKSRQAAAKKVKVGPNAIVPYTGGQPKGSSPGGQPKGSPPVGNDAADPTSRAAVSRATIEQRVAAQHPEIGGRKACAFFFGPAKSCRFDAAVCSNGHHGV